MNIKEYIEANNLSLVEACLKFETSPSTMYCWLAGRYHPTKKKAEQICKITNGQITLEEIRGEKWKKKNSA